MSQDQAANDVEPVPTIQDVGVDFAAIVDEENSFKENLHRDPLIGTMLDGKYFVIEVLGFGGMSVVYKARQEPIDRMVAVKTVKFRVDERPDIWRRFEREVRTLSKLSHPNIVTVYDCVIGHNGQPYVVMDYLKGASLDQVLLKNGRMSLKQAYSVASQVCLAVAHANRHQVIHRDIKPANIMLLEQSISGAYQVDGDEAALVKVVDFGLAKLGEDSRKLTHSGELWGSPPYMSPEQICGRDCDLRADIYSLACVVYEMVTGKDPFWGANVYELLHCHMHEMAPSLATACPAGDFPLQLENVLAKAMSKEPGDRYATMIEFKEALEEACLRPGAERSKVRAPARNINATYTKLSPSVPPRPVSPDSYSRFSPAAAHISYTSLPAGLPDSAISEMPGSDSTDSAGRRVSAKDELVAREAGSSEDSQKMTDLDRHHGHPGHYGNTSHLLTVALTVLILTACILFTVNMARNIEGPKVTRIVNPESVDPRQPSVAGRSELTSARGSQPIKRLVKSEGPFYRRHGALPAHAFHHSAGSSLSSGKTNKISSPNSSARSVDQSKFEMLRRLKSPLLRNEGDPTKN